MHFSLHCPMNFIRKIPVLIGENGIFEISIINWLDLCSYENFLSTFIFLWNFAWGPPQGFTVKKWILLKCHSDYWKQVLQSWKVKKNPKHNWPINKNNDLIDFIFWSKTVRGISGKVLQENKSIQKFFKTT